MTVEARKEPVTDAWPKWQSEVINGIYPLRRYLGGSDHSAVFLTECKARNLASAAIKVVRADRVQTDVQLSYWRMAAGLSHPRLIRLLDAGRCQLGGHPTLFLVMEYAEQTLAQLLPQRALTVDEAQEMLLRALDALAFLHRKNLVQGQLKPANFLVVSDQLKLASDTVRAAGEPTSSLATLSLYDGPEVRDGGLSPASDIWALGMTLVEALTQHLPAWPDERSETARLPATLPPAFVDTVQRCLSRNPASRPTAAELEAQFKPAPRAPVVSAPAAIVRAEPERVTSALAESPRKRLLVPVILAAVVLIAVWAGARLFKAHPNSQPAAVRTAVSAPQPNAGAPVAAAQNSTPSASAPAPVAAPAAAAKPRGSKPASPRAAARRSDQPAQTAAGTSSAVVYEQIPAVPHSARQTIHGHIKVAVVVIVDPAGNVSDALLENPGPSWYFARLARDAAKKWKFAPVDKQDSREWLLRFEFTRGGTIGHSATQRS